ncbi:MAG: S-layer homology domain-containing protein [Clostridiaceae bacterium]|nr:S-layer homology domain-containing protein [Clostridiaceae bacterium]
MKNLKKLIALMIAFAMMLTFVTGVAFADEATDEEATAAEETVEEAVEETVEEQPTVTQPVSIDGSKYASSVIRAQKFGIMIGDPSGDLRPNDPVKRSEFMTMLVRAMGYEAAAVAAKGITKFADVPADHWASGYVNVTVQLGVTVGKSETSFAPDDYVTTTEALAFIERAMGYEVLAKEKGGWPTGYLVVAKDRSYGLNLLDGVTEDVNLPAPRGLIAKLFDNALAAPFYDIVSYEGGVPTYAQLTNVTFLTKMGYKKLKAGDEDEFILVQIPYYGSDDNKVALVPVDKRDSGAIEKELNGEFDLDSLMGTRVEAYVDEDGKIVDIQMTQKDKTTVVAVAEISLDGNAIKIKDEDGNEKKYDAVDDILPFVANFKLGVSTKGDKITVVLDEDKDGDGKKDTAEVVSPYNKAFASGGAFGDKTDLIEATAVIYDGKIDFLYGFKYEKPGLVSQVRDNNVTGEQSIKTENGFYYISKNKDERAKFVEIIKDGDEIDLDDIVEDEDIAYVAAKEDATKKDNAKDNRIRILVVNDTISGELKGVTYEKGGSKAVKVKIDSTTYDVYEPAELSTWDVKVGDTVLARLTKDGKVLQLKFEDGAVSDEYAVVLYMWKETDSKTKKETSNLTLLKADGSKVDYKVDDDSNAQKVLDGQVQGKTVEKGSLVKFKLNSDNEVIELDPAAKVNVTADTDKRRVDGKVTKSDIILFNVSDYKENEDTEEVEASVVSWDILKDKNDVHAYFVDDDGVVVAVLLFDAASDVKYGVITERLAIKDNKAHFVLITADGIKEYDSKDANIDDEYSAGKFIAYTVTADGKIVIDKNKTNAIVTVPALSNGKLVAASIESIDARNIKVGGSVYGFGDNVVVYYNEDLDADNDFEEMEKDELVKYMEVVLFIADNDVIGVGVAVK